MKIFKYSITLLTLTYILLGSLYVNSGIFDSRFYLTSIGIISAIASIVTIVQPFIQPSLRSELGKIQPSLLKDITTSMDELKNTQLLLSDTQNKLTEQERQLLTIQLKKNELELTVKKASLSIFLTDQLERNNSKLKEILESNREIVECLETRKSIEMKLNELNEEVKEDDNYKFFYDLIQKDDFNYRKSTHSNSKLLPKLYTAFYGGANSRIH